MLFWLLLRCLRSVGLYLEDDPRAVLHIMGGGARRSKKIAVSVLRDCHLVIGSLADLRDTDTLLYDHVGPAPASPHDPMVVVLAVPLHILGAYIPKLALRSVVSAHNLSVRNVSDEQMYLTLQNHVCSITCAHIFAHFKRPFSYSSTAYVQQLSPVSLSTSTFQFPCSTKFPPTPLSARARMEIIRGWCDDISADTLLEEPCGVCAELVQKPNLSTRVLDDPVFNSLIRKDHTVAVTERFSPGDHTIALSTPLIHPAGITFVGGIQLVSVCMTCNGYLKRGRRPPRSLANGLWLGDVPSPLQKANYVEKMLIAAVRHNVFVVNVTMGQRKMNGNAVCFAQPVSKVYKILPPPRKDLEDCLIVLFTGPCKPTAADLKRTPLLVRRHVVLECLQWLILNHKDYKHITISHKNLQSYSESAIPVEIIYRPTTADDTTPPQTLPVNDDGQEKGTASGPCAFTVNAVAADSLAAKSKKQKIAIAMQHMKSGGKILAVGHAAEPESIYKNSSLFPRMFPWLFPYGLGGYENGGISSRLGCDQHTRHLLLYHDRRFQLDEYFAFVTFSHKQIRANSVGAHVLTEWSNFADIVKKWDSLDVTALSSLIERAEKGDRLSPTNSAERLCFELLHHLEHAQGFVPCSAAQKRKQRNEIKSLIFELGTPSFFITFSPADIKSPICLYYAGEKIDISAINPKIPDACQRLRAIAQNPVAGARFFHLMVRLFIKHILRWQSGTDGLFGPTSGFFGSIEAQGRQTLHFHVLLWIMLSLSPQDIRDRALRDDVFQSELITWLESVCVSGLPEDPVSALPVSATPSSCDTNTAPTAMPLGPVLSSSSDNGPVDSTDPTSELPLPPPSSNCSDDDVHRYMQHVIKTVNKLILQNHIHRCGNHCQRDGYCKGRFPREKILKSFFDENGALHLRHNEEWINVLTDLIAFLERCNSDTTCLLSGTQVRAVVAYITDYITKQQLRTYTIFEVIRAVYDKNSVTLSAMEDRSAATRLLITKVGNALSAKMETGGPMLCAELLGLPDHYASHQFKPFYWSPYLRHVASHWHVDLSNSKDGKGARQMVMLSVDRDNNLIPLSKVNDYMMRPTELEGMSLFEFIRRTSVTYYKWPVSAANVINDADDDCDYEPTDPECLDTDTLDVDEEHGDDTPNQRITRLRFHESHPKHNTHAVILEPEDPLLIVDFKPCTLPRKNVNAEAYYLCMLMLFKPGGWRAPADIKDPDMLWEDAFATMQFSDHAQKLMRNMNLLYECADARDDYSAQRRHDRAKQSLGMFSTQDLNELDVERNEDDTAAIHTSDVDNAVEHADVSSICTDRNRKRMDEMYDLLEFLSIGDPPLQSDTCQPLDTTATDATDWSKVLKEAKDAKLRSRNPDFDDAVGGDGPIDGSSAPGDFDVVGDGTVCFISPSSCNIQRHTTYLEKMDPKLFVDCGISGSMKETCAHFTLNVEQVRAFVTVANAVLDKQDNQLLMYLGGMGGTGKSQVIKALTSFFASRNERGRVCLMAPTGSAACLINGATYHSVLRFGRNSNKITDAQVSEIRDNLDGVDLVFIDEVSMISCTDLLKISTRMARARNQLDKPFGGIHVVLAGDFCQLPPAAPGSFSLYTGVKFNGTKNAHIDAAGGLAIWQLFTTVVILRDNMRQNGMSIPDKLLRTALSNVRLHACTDADMALLDSRSIQSSSDAPRLSDPDFRFVSIITGLNSQRDAINTVMSKRFEHATQQELVSFYSRDTPSKTKKDLSGSSGGHFDAKVQSDLWDVPTCQLGTVLPGKLQICVGIPVMLKHNAATELCMTNGAEGIVVGWTASKTRSGKQILSVLFVQLVKPPTDVQLPGLPLNVVPVLPRKESVRVQLQSSAIWIIREQIPVIVNFAMTDYCAQGRTRPFNPVDLQHCRNHQAVYTALSRCSSLNGLLLLSNVDPAKMKGGLSGDLRRELLEHEMLDDISDLRFRQQLPESVTGLMRKDLLESFRQHHNGRYVPRHSVTARAPTKTVHNKRPLPHVVESVGNKRICLDEGTPTLHVELNAADGPMTAPSDTLLGSRWDSVNHSCAYDALLTLIYNTSQFYPLMWSCLEFENEMIKYFFICLNAHGTRLTQSSKSILEITREDFRNMISLRHPDMFPRHGTEPTDIVPLIQTMAAMTGVTGIARVYGCSACGWSTGIHEDVDSIILHAPLLESEYATTGYSTTALVRNALAPLSDSRCPYCNIQLTANVEFRRDPGILVLLIPTTRSSRVQIDLDIDLMMSGKQHGWSLQGAVYHGGAHFTCQVVDVSDDVWYHDGIETGAHCRWRGNKDVLNSRGDLNMVKNREVCLLVYRHTTVNGT